MIVEEIVAVLRANTAGYTPAMAKAAAETQALSVQVAELNGLIGAQGTEFSGVAAGSSELAAADSAAASAARALAVSTGQAVAANAEQVASAAAVSAAVGGTVAAETALVGAKDAAVAATVAEAEAMGALSASVGGLGGTLAGAEAGETAVTAASERATVATVTQTAATDSLIGSLAAADTALARTGVASAGSLTRAKGALAALTSGWVLAAAAIVAFGVVGVRAYTQHMVVLKQLENVERNMPALADATTASFVRQAKQLQDLSGFGHDQILAADTILGRFKLTQTQIEHLIPLVVDYARATGRDVPEAATLVGRAFLGSARALTTIGIAFHRTGDTAKDLATIITLLQSRVGGAAEAFGHTLAGALAIAKQAIHDVAQTLGADFAKFLVALVPLGHAIGKLLGAVVLILPPLLQFGTTLAQTLLPAFLPLIDATALFVAGLAEVVGAILRFKPVAYAVAVILGTWGFATATSSVIALGSAIVGLIPVIGSATISMLGLDVAMDANPVGILILGIAALGAGLILLVKHLNQVKAVFSGLPGPVKIAVETITAVMFPLIVLPLEIISHWQGIAAFFGGIFHSIADAAAAFAGAWTAMWDSVKGAATGVVNFLIKFLFNPILWGLNQIVKALDIALGPLINFPNVPQLHLIGQDAATSATNLTDMGGAAKQAGADVNSIPAHKVVTIEIRREGIGMPATAVTIPVVYGQPGAPPSGYAPAPLRGMPMPTYQAPPQVVTGPVIDEKPWLEHIGIIERTIAATRDLGNIPPPPPFVPSDPGVERERLGNMQAMIDKTVELTGDLANMPKPGAQGIFPVPTAADLNTVRTFATLTGQSFTDLVAQARTAFAGGDVATKEFLDGVKSSMVAWRQQFADSVNFVAQSLGSLAGQEHLTAGQIIAEFQKSMDAMDAYGKNFQKLSQWGGHSADDFLTHIANMGQQGQVILQAFADGNKAQFDKAVGIWNNAQAKSNDLATVIQRDLVGSINQLIAAIREALGLPAIDFRFTVDTGPAWGAIQAFNAKLAAAGFHMEVTKTPTGEVIPKPTGQTGLIVPGGYGGGDSVPILAEPGEVVIRKEAVRAMGGPEIVHQALNQAFQLGGIVAAPVMDAGGYFRPHFEAGGVVGTLASAGRVGVLAGGIDRTAYGLGHPPMIAGVLGTPPVMPTYAAAAVGATGHDPYAAVLAAVFAQHGWFGAQVTAGEWIAGVESGYSLTAKNPTSTAYGYPQFLLANWIAYVGQYPPPTSAPIQISAYANYIRDRYETPLAAQAFHLAHGWYGGGLDAVFHKPTIIGVGESGPERVQVTPEKPGIQSPQAKSLDERLLAAHIAGAVAQGMRQNDRVKELEKSIRPRRTSWYVER